MEKSCDKKLNVLSQEQLKLHLQLLIVGGEPHQGQALFSYTQISLLFLSSSQRSYVKTYE